MAAVRAVPKKTLVIAGAIVVVLLFIVLLLVGNRTGQSVKGIDDEVELKTVTTETGEKYKVAVIEGDIDIERAALDYYRTCYEEGDGVHWLVDPTLQKTVMITESNGTVLVCAFEYTEGEEEEPSLLGTGELTETWILDPETRKNEKM